MFKYLRLSITDRCNFRCIYCMPEEGICKQNHANILRFEEMLIVVRAAIAHGIEQVRITGGEPLVRKGVIGFIRELASLSAIKDLCLTTNAAKLADMAEPLKNAGLGRVNVSLDSLNQENFTRITRIGDLKQVLAGIQAAIAVGLQPVKINTVIIPEVNDHEICDFARFAFENEVEVRFIERMPFSAKMDEQNYFSEAQVCEIIRQNFELCRIESGNSHGPAHSFKIAGGKGKIGFISPRTRPFCKSCARLRLTADGYLLPCLDSDMGIQVRGLPQEQVEKIIIELYQQKHAWRKNQACFNRTFDSSLAKIGG